MLIDHFIQRYNQRLDKSIDGVTKEAERLLVGHSWPGNVRELENAVERAMVLAEGNQITVDDLPERIRQIKDTIRMALGSDELSIKKTVRMVEEELIRRALKKTDGNRTAAAKLLEISHRALLYKIKDFGIS